MARYTVRPRGGVAWSEHDDFREALREAGFAANQGLSGVLVIDLQSTDPDLIGYQPNGDRVVDLGDGNWASFRSLR